MVLNDGLQGSDYIDSETFLLLGSQGRVPMHSRAEHFDVLNLDEDYRRVAGILYPFRIRTVDALSGKTVSGDRGWDTIEANVPYDRSFFSPPTVTPEPLTALTEYLLSVAGSVSPASQWFSPYPAFRKNPDNSAVDSENDLNWLGYELLKQNALEDALIVFRTLLQEHPNSANAYDSLGDGLAQAGRINEAIKAFDVAVKLNPQANATKEKLESLKKTGRIPPQY